MKKTVGGLAATLFSLAVYATGPGGDPGASGYFSAYLSASERSDDETTYVYIYRQEYTDGYAYGYVWGSVDGTYFDCQLDYGENLLAVDAHAESAVIHVGPEDVEWCSYNWLPAPTTFDCVASGYMASKGVSNQETTYYDGYEYKAHTSFAENALDCVVFISDDIVLDARSGIVWDGTAQVHKYILPNQESVPVAKAPALGGGGRSLEWACVASGGRVTHQMCCLSVGDFPNTCIEGACGCDADNSHRVKVCKCPVGKCFDGSSCVPFARGGD